MKNTTEFIEFQKVNGLKKNTLINIESKFKQASKWKPISNWKQEDVSKYISFMIDEGFKQSYIEMTKSLLKRYFIWAGKEKFVKDIKIKFPKISLKSSDILTPDDVNKLIEAATLPRDKALIAALFESGARISELIAIRVKDLEETPQGMKVLIPGTKTGEEYRPCLLINSAQYVRNHVIYPPLKLEDKVFDFTSMTAQRILKDAGKRAGINKPTNPHRLRHAQATYMTRKGYQESIIRAKLGWTGDSGMISRYTHLDGNDILNSTFEMEGGKEHIISPELVKSITPGAPINIADPSMEFARLNNENEEIKEMVKTQQMMYEREIQNLQDKINSSDPLIQLSKIEDENLSLRAEIGSMKRDHQFELQAMDNKIDQLNRYLVIAFKDPKIIKDLENRVMKK